MEQAWIPQITASTCACVHHDKSLQWPQDARHFLASQPHYLRLIGKMLYPTVHMYKLCSFCCTISFQVDKFMLLQIPIDVIIVVVEISTQHHYCDHLNCNDAYRVLIIVSPTLHFAKRKNSRRGDKSKPRLCRCVRLPSGDVVKGICTCIDIQAIVVSNIIQDWSGGSFSTLERYTTLIGWYLR